MTNPLDPIRLAAPLTLRVNVGGTTLAEQPLSAVPYARSVHGLVQVDLNGACTPALEGALSTQGGGLSICRGSAWREVEPPVPAGCRAPLPISAITLSPDNGGAAALRDGLPYNLASWSGYPTNQVFEVAIDLGSTERVCGVAYTTDWHTKSPRDVQLQTSTDGSAWTTASTVVGTHSAFFNDDAASPRSDNTFALSANTRYVRLRVTSSRNPGWLMLGEVYVYTYE